MRKVIVLASVLALTGCGAKGKTFSGPAQEGALDCALGQSSALGYYPLDGGKSDGYIKVAREIPWTKGAVAGEAVNRLMSFGLSGSNRVEYDHLTLTGAGGTLRILAVGVRQNGSVDNPTPDGEKHAQDILGSCSK
jgi:hypothetical protein